MSEYHAIPNPRGSSAGSAYNAITAKLSSTMAKWRPRNAPANESSISTLARYAVRVISPSGDALTSDEILSLAAAAAAAATTLNKFNATTIPSVADDAADGYAVGSLWIDIVGNEAYRCVDATIGAAIWIETTYDAVEVAALIRAGNTAIVPTVATNYAVPTPADGTYAGQKAVYHVKSAAGGNLTLSAGIKTASDSLATFPKALTANQLYIVQLVWGANGWMLATLIGGYA